MLPESHSLTAHTRISLAGLVGDTFLLSEDPPGTGMAASVRDYFTRTGFTPPAQHGCQGSSEQIVRRIIRLSFNEYSSP